MNAARACRSRLSLATGGRSGPFQVRWWALVLGLALVLAACGSRLDRRELAAGLGVASVPASLPGGETSARGGSTDSASQRVASAPSSESSGGRAASDAAAARRGSPKGEGPRSVLPARKGEILLGSVGTGTGIVGAALKSIPVAVRAWVADVNARGGLNGHPVRVVFGDDGGDPGRALAIVRRMVEEDGVLAFMGGYATTTSQGFIPYLERKGVPMVGNSGSPSDDASPIVFNPQASSRGNQLSIITSIASQTPARKVALVYCRESASCSSGAAWIKEYAPNIKMQIVYEAQISIAQPDFTAEMIGARNAGANAVAIIADGNTMARIARSAQRQGWRPYLSGGIGLNDDGVVKAGGADLEGFLGSANVAPYSVDPQMRPYVAAVRRYVPGGAIAGPGSAAWVQGKLWERIAPALGDRPTPKQVIDALYSLRNEDLGGLIPPLTFPRGPQGHGRMNMCTVSLRISRGRIMAPLGTRHFVCAT